MSANSSGHRPTTITGLILAGGQGQRLGGVRKRELRLANVSLLDWTRKGLAGQVETLLLSLATSESLVTDESAIVLPDPTDGVSGPAAGLQAGARWISEHIGESVLFTVPVDTPFIPADFVSRALPLLSADIGCVQAGYGGRDYPTTALWKTGPLLDVLEREPQNPKGPSLRDIAARVGVAICGFDDHPANPFTGVNTLADLLSLSAMMKSRAKTD